MKYLMFVYGSSESINSEDITTKIGKELQPVTTDGSSIKYVFGDENAIFHFNSDLSFQEMTIYADMVIDSFPEFLFVLLPFNGEISSNFDDDRMKHLLDVGLEKNKTDKNRIDIEIDEVLLNDDTIFDVFIGMINDTNNSFGKKKKEVICEMTLDELLDKIADHGINSLSDIERKKLEEYSK